MTEHVTPRAEKSALTSKTVLLALGGTVLTKVAEYFGVTPEQLYDYVVYGAPALMLFARELTAGGLRWIPQPIKNWVADIKAKWWPNA